MRLLIGQVRRRHGRSDDALHHDGDQFIIGGRSPESPVAEIHAGYDIAIRPVAVGAIDAVELLAGLDVGGTVALLRAQRAGHQGSPRRPTGKPQTAHGHATFRSENRLLQAMLIRRGRRGQCGWGFGGGGRITGIFVFGDVFFPLLTKRSQVERGSERVRQVTRRAVGLPWGIGSTVADLGSNRGGREWEVVEAEADGTLAGWSMAPIDYGDRVDQSPLL